MMTKEKLARELMVKWLLENKGTNPGEVLEEITSYTYTEEKLKEANWVVSFFYDGYYFWFFVKFTYIAACFHAFSCSSLGKSATNSINLLAISSAVLSCSSVKRGSDDLPNK